MGEPKYESMVIRVESKVKRALESESARTGAPQAELVRRALRSYLGLAEP